MPLETGPYISSLVPTNPDPTDNEAFGAQHLQLIKSTLKASLNGFPGVVLLTGTDTGTANAYAITPQTAISAYTLDMLVLFTPVNSPTGASTLSIGGLSPANIVHTNGIALASGDMPAGKFALLAYDGTNFQLISADASKVDRNNGTSTNQTLNTPTINGATGTLNNIVMTGIPLVPTAAPGTSTQQPASTAFVGQAIVNGNLPSAIDTSWQQYGINAAMRANAYAQ